MAEITIFFISLFFSQFDSEQEKRGGNFKIFQEKNNFFV